MRYCDGHSWTGAVSNAYVDGDKPPLYFRGINNVEAMMRTLLERHGMSEATDVIAYGCSSGAIGVTANADLMQSLMPKTIFFVALSLVLNPDSPLKIVGSYVKCRDMLKSQDVRERRG
eukprot:6486935-Amphidinium_carterae.1